MQSQQTILTKPHYAILDALRGVAAIMVVIFHVLEAHATSHFDLMINHGYLAVDFFFLLSGFVIGYAYDDRWDKLTLGNFFKRRLVRLQPMVVMGMIIGAIGFYFSASEILFPKINEVPVWQLIGIMLIGCTMLPVTVPMDIRGWAEMHPLNGPAWSLFYEYIANILYALFVRRFSNTVLAILVFLSGCFLIHMLFTNPLGDVIGGWSLDWKNIQIGFARMLYPFFAGLLLSRVVKIGRIPNAFLISTLLIIVFLSMPRVGGSEDVWKNALYESLTIILIFPLIVYIGASGEVTGKFATKLSKFLGEISYPLYITHYPLIYIYFSWVYDNKVSLSEALLMGLLLLVSSIVIAYACLKLYDEPVRAWLKKKLSV